MDSTVLPGVAQAQEPITLSLTYPPSANRLWRNVKGRMVKAAPYRAWLSANEWAGAGKGTVAGPYALTIIATAPDRRRRDLDNLIKPIGDCLQHIGVIADDCAMRELTAIWAPPGVGGVTITIRGLQ